MADSSIQLEIEKWIRTNWLPQKYGQPFNPRQLKLKPGGGFIFDAVSEDGAIVALISTSSARTAGGKFGAGKMQKLRADMLFLLLAPAQMRLIVLSEPDMFKLCRQEKKVGRVPEEIEFVLAEIPEELRQRLAGA